MAATVLREVPSEKLVTRAEVAFAPQADTPGMTRRRRLAKPGMSCTVKIPSSSIERRNCSPELASPSLPKWLESSLKAILGTFMRAFSVAWAIVERHASMAQTSEMVVARMFPFAFTGDARHRAIVLSREPEWKIRWILCYAVVFGSWGLGFRNMSAAVKNPGKKIPPVLALTRISRADHRVTEGPGGTEEELPRRRSEAKLRADRERIAAKRKRDQEGNQELETAARLASLAASRRRETYSMPKVFAFPGRWT